MRAILLAFLALAAPAATEASLQQTGAPPPADAAYHFMLGRHLEGEGHVDAALSAFKQAIALQPESAELRAELAGFFARQDRASEAVDAAQAALERDPENREANRILGSIYAAFAEQREALKPGDDVSRYPSLAIASLERAQRDSVLDTALELTLGRLYVTSGAFAKAVATLDRVLVDQPGYPEAVWLLAYAHEGSGNIDKAIETLASGQPFYRGRLHLGELFEKQRQWKNADAAYAEAQTLNPRG
jgi:tetratricopeptide (TPR) repeat protein